MDNKKKIEIPFGAFDSELIRQEINIPNGFKAVIDENKIILTRVESEDEKIKKAIHIYLDWLDGRKDYQPKGDYTIKDMLAWLEKQGQTFTKRDVDDAHIEGMACAKNELEKQSEQKPTDKVEPFDKYEGLTDFERTLADICIGWIGEELGWKQYIKDNADVLLKIAVEKFNSVQDVPFEQKSAWGEEDERLLNNMVIVIQDYYNII